MTTTATVSKAKTTTKAAVKVVAKTAPKATAKEIKITGNYNNDLKAAIAAELFPSGARPKKADVKAAIEQHNQSLAKPVAAVKVTPPPAAPELVTHYVDGPIQSDLKGVVSTPTSFQSPNGNKFRKVQIPAALEAGQLEIYQNSGAKCLTEKAFATESGTPGSATVAATPKAVDSKPLVAVKVSRYYVVGGEGLDLEGVKSAEALHHWQEFGDLRVVEVPQAIVEKQLAVYTENSLPMMTESDFMNKLAKRSMEIVTRKAKITTAKLSTEGKSATGAARKSSKAGQLVNIEPKAEAVLSKPGTFRRQLVELFEAGCTLEEIAAIIPATNKAKPRAFITYVASFGFGIKQDGAKFFLVKPATVIEPK